MYDTDIKSDIETNTYLHSNSSHKGVVCVILCVGFNARLFFCHFAFEIYKILERRSDNINGNYFTLPNKIFDEGFTPNEFVVYSFLTKTKNKSSQSYWSVPNIAHYCGICNTTCRKTLSSLKEKGYIEISERYRDNVQQSNIYTVNRI